MAQPRGNDVAWLGYAPMTGSLNDECVVILGTGAVGSIAAAYLVQSGVDVAAFDGWHAHVEAMRRSGLHVSGPDEEFTVTVRAFHIDELHRLGRPIDILLLALKSYDTEWAVRYAAPYLARDGVVVSLQNGMNEARIAGIVGAERTLGCVVHLAGELRAPGSVVASSGRSWPAYTLGELDRARTPRVARIADALGCVGITRVSPDIGAALWAKLVLNVMTNGLSGITGFTTRELWQDERAVPVILRLGGEATDVAAAREQRVDDLDPPGAREPLRVSDIRAAHHGDRAAHDRLVSAMVDLARSRSGKRENRSSLLQDILRRRRPEIDYLNGYVVEMGATCGVPTPTNAAVVELVKAVATGERELGAGNLASIGNADNRTAIGGSYAGKGSA